MIESQDPLIFETKEKKRKKIIFSILGVIIFCLVGIGLSMEIRHIRSRISIYTPITTPTPTPDPMAPKNVLLLGYGGAGHDGGLLTDTMILAHVIPKEKKVVLISIPRDLWVPMEVRVGTASAYKINAAFAIGSDDKAYQKKPQKYQGDKGGLMMAEDAVETITGLPVDFAVAIDFSGFSKIIKTLGGIFIDVPYAFEDKLYPVKGLEKETCGKSEEDLAKTIATLSGQLLEQEFPCRYETLKFEKGKQFMDGDLALKFVRSRHSDVNGGDFGRSLRQQAFLLGVKNRLLSFASATKIIPLFKDGLGMVNTDFSYQDGVTMLERYGSISSYSMDSIFLTDQTILTFATSSDRQSILIPKTGEGDWDSVHAYITRELTRISESTKSAVVQ